MEHGHSTSLSRCEPARSSDGWARSLAPRIPNSSLLNRPCGDFSATSSALEKAADRSFGWGDQGDAGRGPTGPQILGRLRGLPCPCDFDMCQAARERATRSRLPRVAPSTGDHELACAHRDDPPSTRVRTARGRDLSGLAHQRCVRPRGKVGHAHRHVSRTLPDDAAQPQVVEEREFETDDPQMRGVMRNMKTLT